MVKPEHALVFKDVASLHCYETKEIDSEIGNAWDICKILHSDETVEKVRGVLGVKIDNDQVNRMVSDDDLLYVRFKDPSSIFIFKGED